MDSATKARQAAFERRFVGYLVAVTGAAVTALLLLFVSVYLSAPNPSFDFVQLWEGAFLIPLTFVVFWMFAFLSASVPAYIAINIAQRFDITNAGYFLICGALAGAVGAFLVPTWYTDPPKANSLSTHLDVLRLSIPAGVAGGGLYWWKVLRRSD